MSSPDRRHGQRGAVLVLVALGLLVLFGAAGLGVDGGRMFLERRQAQGAADNAATAAAYTSCHGGSDTAAINAGRTSAAANGYDNNGATNVVTITPLGNHHFEAHVQATIGATFAGAAGFGSFDVAAEAMAGCSAGAAGVSNTIYGGGDNCAGGKYAVNVNGSTSRVFGGVHSNSDFAVTGGSNAFTDPTDTLDDPVTYVGTMKDGSDVNGNVYQTGYPLYVGPSLPDPIWPGGWAPSDANADLFAAYRAVAQAGKGLYSTSKIENITGDGVYYTTSTDGIVIGSSNITGTIRNVVLVAENGPVVISSNTKTLNAYSDPDLPRQHVLLLAGKVNSGLAKCDTPTAELSGGDMDWNGIMWVPHGQIKMSGSSNTAVHGALIGWAIELNGSDLTIQFDPLLAPSAPGEVLLYE